MDFILRPWKESDAKTLARHLNNKKIWDNCLMIRLDAIFILFHLFRSVFNEGISICFCIWKRQPITAVIPYLLIIQMPC